jgi:hypothetical protein
LEAAPLKRARGRNANSGYKLSSHNYVIFDATRMSGVTFR